MFSTYIRKLLKYQINENPSSGSRDVPCGQTDSHDELIVAFPNFVNAAAKVIFR